jgi:hypothetical protein
VREAQPEIFDLVLYCAIKLASSKRRHFSVPNETKLLRGTTTARSVMAGRIVAFGNLLWPFRFYS